VALALHDVGSIHSRGDDLNQNLAGAWLRRRTLSQAQNFRATGRGNLDGCHRHWNVRIHRVITHDAIDSG